jgi:hypothetical protein
MKVRNIGATGTGKAGRVSEKQQLLSATTAKKGGGKGGAGELFSKTR